MNLNWLQNNLIYMTVAGSQCYGLDNELSDLDLKGICIPPSSVENDLFQNFNQAENDVNIHKKYEYLKNPKNPKIESTIFSLKKFFKLAAEVNPNIVELLFVDPNDILLQTPVMDELLKNRDLFLSSKAKYTFAGYAASQLHRIERHRKWIIRGEIKEPKREDYGLPPELPKRVGEIFGLIKSEVEHWNLTSYKLDEMEREDLKSTIWELIYNVSNIKIDEGNWPQMYASGVIERISSEYNLNDEIVNILQRERLYKKEMEAYSSWLNWKKNRNPARHELEVKCGYDAKHASHLIRLQRMGYEIISEGRVIVKRPDRDELLYIKNGGWSYDKVIEYSNEMNKKLDEAYKTTKLPKRVDCDKINELYQKLLNL